MALNATMYRFNVNLSDLNRSVYQDFAVSVALHPSETLERMAIRFIAYCLDFSEQLVFTKGLSTEEEPDIWEKSYSDEILRWIELGLPDGKRLKKACSLAKQVEVFAYGGQAVSNWWQQTRGERLKANNLRIRQLDSEAVLKFADSLSRGMSISCLIDGDVVNLSWEDQMLEVHVEELVEGAV